MKITYDKEVDAVYLKLLDRNLMVSSKLPKE